MLNLEVFQNFFFKSFNICNCNSVQISVSSKKDAHHLTLYIHWSILPLF